MPSILLVVLLVEVAVQLVNTVGAAAVTNLLWAAVNTVPTAHSREVAQQRKLQQEYLKCRRDLKATSSQDEFAKWARLRRHHDKLLEQLEKKKSQLESTRAAFDKYATGIRWLLTNGVKWTMPLWYAKEPMFWLPYGWFPSYIEWAISFPRAPMGSVSIGAWQMACTVGVGLVFEMIGAVVALVAGARGKQTEAPMAGRPSTGVEKKGSNPDTSEEKKTR